MLRRLVILPLIGAAALVMTGCPKVVHSGDSTYFTFPKRDTDVLMAWYHSPDCAQDIDHNGSVDATDRANCTFFLMRVNYCNNESGAEKLYCNASTDSRYATNFAYEALDRVNPCFAARFRPGGVVEWGQYKIGQVGCTS
jgi:hypothetical protein